MKDFIYKILNSLFSINSYNLELDILNFFIKWSHHMLLMMFLYFCYFYMKVYMFKKLMEADDPYKSISMLNNINMFVKILAFLLFFLIILNNFWFCMKLILIIYIVSYLYSKIKF